jgi:hypothetical protein
MMGHPIRVLTMFLSSPRPIRDGVNPKLGIKSRAVTRLEPICRPVPFLQKKASLSMTKHAHKPARAARLQAIVPANLSKTGSDCNSVSLVGALHLLIETVGLWRNLPFDCDTARDDRASGWELLALRWQDVDFEKGFFSARQTVYEGHLDVPKGKRSKRTLPLGSVCAEIFTSLRKPGVNPSALIFSARNGSPLSRRDLLKRQLRPTAKAVGMPEANWHGFRHAATFLDSVGTPLGTVQALLGHSSPEVTSGIYIGSVPENARTAVENVEKSIGPKWTQVPV